MPSVFMFSATFRVLPYSLHGLIGLHLCEDGKICGFRTLYLCRYRIGMEYIMNFEIANNGEDDRYYDQSIDKLMNEFEKYTSPICFVSNIQEIYETIEFDSKPLSEITLKQIQEHFIFLGVQYLKYLHEDIKEEGVFEFSCKLMIKGEDGKSTTDLLEFIQGVRYDLPNADGFVIESYYRGPALYLNDEVREEFVDLVPKMDKEEPFTYRIYEYLGSSGEASCAKYENGDWVELEDEFSEAIIDKTYDFSWEANELILQIDFDFENTLRSSKLFTKW